MWVTCYTDASWDDTGRGGWAYRLVSDKGRFDKSGRCPAWVRCNNTAEFSAIVAGIYRALREWDDVEGVSVHTDSDAAIRYFKFYPAGVPRTLRRDDWLVLRKKLYEILEDHECMIKFTHVKGHQLSTLSRRAYMNNNVDDMSRRARLGRFVNRGDESA